MYYTNEELDQYIKQIKLDQDEYLKSAVPQIIQSLRKSPNNYLAFGVYWYHVKKVIQDLSSGDDWFYGDFHDQLIMETSDHGDDFRNVVAALVYADDSSYFSSSTHTYTWNGDPRSYILEDDDFLLQEDIPGGEVATESVSRGGAKKLETMLEKKYNVKIGIIQSSAGIEFSKLIVPKEERGKGIGSKVMKSVIAFADKNGIVIGLTPSKDFGGTLGRLKTFYKRFGFVDNKGRNKDYSFMTSMVRNPKKIGSVATESVEEIEDDEEIIISAYTPEEISIFPDIEGISIEAVSSINFNDALGKPISFLTDQIKSFEKLSQPLPKGDYKEVTMKIVSKGRKWVKGTYPGKSYQYQILKNDFSKDFEVGEQYTFDAVIEDKSTKYGKSFVVTPIDPDIVGRLKEVSNKPEVERWLGFVEGYVDQGDGYLYPKGMSKLKELGIKKYPELQKRLDDAIQKATEDKSKGKVKNLHKTAKQYLGYIDEHLHEYWYENGETKVMEVIGELQELGENFQPLKDELDFLKEQFKGFEEKKEISKQEKLSGLNEIRDIIDMPAVSEAQSEMKRVYGISKGQGFLRSGDKSDFRDAQAVIEAEDEKLMEKGIRSSGLKDLIQMNVNRLDRDNPSDITNNDIADIEKEDEPEPEKTKEYETPSNIKTLMETGYDEYEQ